jgi:hypothetical protein
MRSPCPPDKKAKVVIHAKTDGVLAGVMRRLSLAIPDYVRVDRLVVSHVLKNADAKGINFVLRVGSAHGWGCPMPWLARVEVSFSIVRSSGGSGGGGDDDNSGRNGGRSAGGGAGGGGGSKSDTPTFRPISSGAMEGKGPFQWKRKCPNIAGIPSDSEGGDGDGGGGGFQLVACVLLTFGEGCTVRGAVLDYVVGLGESPGSADQALRGVEHSFETIRVAYPIEADESATHTAGGADRNETTHASRVECESGDGEGSDAKRRRIVTDGSSGSGDGSGGGGGGGDGCADSG